MGFKEFYKKMKLFQSLLTADGVKKILKEKEELFEENEIIDTNKFLVLANNNDSLSLIVFTDKRAYKLYAEDKAVLNWTKPINELILAKKANINPIKIDENGPYDIYIFPFVGSKKYKVQKTLFFNKSFVDSFNEMLE